MLNERTYSFVRYYVNLFLSKYRLMSIILMAFQTLVHTDRSDLVLGTSNAIISAQFSASLITTAQTDDDNVTDVQPVLRARSINQNICIQCLKFNQMSRNQLTS